MIKKIFKKNKYHKIQTQKMPKSIHSAYGVGDMRTTTHAQRTTIGSILLLNHYIELDREDSEMIDRLHNSLYDSIMHPNIEPIVCSGKLLYTQHPDIYSRGLQIKCTNLITNNDEEKLMFENSEINIRPEVFNLIKINIRDHMLAHKVNKYIMGKIRQCIQNYHTKKYQKQNKLIKYHDH